ncbi:C2 domain-containing protein 5 [Halocaridina rubra]|uniref:C2 domain-containing protein 5 n=1 Tax=Halocaridina rubra TaxID=373956 RepID=A0AAN8X2R9_HALRR
MPISVVHIPQKLSSVIREPPTSVLLSYPPSGSATYSKCKSAPFISQHPSQWLDLMVHSSPEQAKSHPGQLALTNAKRVIRGLPLMRRKRVTTVTQHPPVYLQRNSSFPHGQRSLYLSTSLNHQKCQRAKYSWPIHNPNPSISPNLSGMHSSHRGSRESLKAGLKRTAQKMMKFKGSLEKSQSFDVGGSVKSMKASSCSIGKSSSMKITPMVHSPMGRFLGKSHLLHSKQWKHRTATESMTSPEDVVDDWELDSPDVEVIGLEEEDVVQFSDEDIGQEVTNIEYSYKTLSTAFSDPTLNKSIYAKQFCRSDSTLGPIQVISSDEDTCSSGPASSDFSCPEHEVKRSIFNSRISPTQKFYVSEEELTSQSSLESHFTGPVHVNDLNVSDWSVESPESCQSITTLSVQKCRFKSHSVGECDRRKYNSLIPNVSSDEPPHIFVDETEGADYEKKSFVKTGERKSGLNTIEALSTPGLKSMQMPAIDVLDDVAKQLGDTNVSESSPVKTENCLRPSVLHVSSGILPDIAVTPSSPVMPLKNRNVPLAFSEGYNYELGYSSYSNSSHNIAFLDIESSNAKASERCVTASSSSSSRSEFSNAYDASKVNFPSPAPLLHTSYSDSLITSHSFSYVNTPSLSSSISSPSSPYSSSCNHVASTVSMDSGDLPHCAVAVAAAKCSSHPMYISSLDMLMDARPGSASMVGSPKRSSRSRHTSGCYPISRSPLPTDIDGSKSDSGIGGPAVNGGGGATHSPTHSGKLASPARTPGVTINRRSSDSDLSITPKGGSLAGSGGSSGGGGGAGGVGGGTGKGGTLAGVHRPVMTQDSFDMLEYPFLTMKKFPSGFLLHLGGTVSARSVKLLDRTHTPEEVETRDNWWTQLRMEIRSHTRALACNVVLGYEEFTTISDEVCVLNATGTAAVISLHYLDADTSLNLSGAGKTCRDSMTLSLDRKDFEQQQQLQTQQQQGQQTQQPMKSYKEPHSGSQTCMSRSHPCIEDGCSVESSGHLAQNMSSIGASSGPQLLHSTGSAMHSTLPLCTMCHIPYSETSLPFRVKISKCAVCRKGKVPDVLFTTLEPPSGIPITGRGCLIQARVARPKRDLKGELNAKEISDSLPFLEYELHKQLINKMKIKGMNGLFSLRVRVTVGERLVVGIATATAVFLTALQPPPVPRVTSGSSCRENERQITEVQKMLQNTIARNKECYGTKHIVSEPLMDDVNGSHNSDTEDSEDDLPEIDLSSGNKDTCVLELDDKEDAEMIGLLVDGCNPTQLVTVSTQSPPGIPKENVVTNLQMFTRVWRAKVPNVLGHGSFNQYFDRLLQSVYFKVRKLAPCIIAGMQVNVLIPEEDELQISLFGMVMGQGKPTASLTQPQSNLTSSVSSYPEAIVKKSKQDDSELIFKMEECIPPVEDAMKGKNVPNQPPHKSVKQPLIVNASVLSTTSIASSGSSQRSSTRSKSEQKCTTYHTPPRDRYGVEITPLSYVPGGRIERYLGNLNFFFIRESTSIKESGGLSGFMGSFVTEVLALVRAHVAALGGNAMISYFMSECVLLHNPYKNQGQCLINVGGDVVQVMYNAGSSLHDAMVEE